MAEGLGETLEALRFEAADNEHIQITISAGIVGCHSREVSEISELLALCDQSLYEAKRAGRPHNLTRSKSVTNHLDKLAWCIEGRWSMPPPSLEVLSGQLYKNDQPQFIKRSS
ncbi:hypothetical protein [Marinobacter maroccanus]|uniref:hypothetical protein n=1 Tax=Marinobacter maroccanus TaxID=2055143 RepID=UPI003BB2118B